MVQKHNKRAKFQACRSKISNLKFEILERFTVAWAALEFHQTSLASSVFHLPTKYTKNTKNLLCFSCVSWAKLLKNGRNSYLTARRILVQQYIDAENITYVFNRQNFFGRALGGDAAVEEHDYLIGERRR